MKQIVEDHNDDSASVMVQPKSSSTSFNSDAMHNNSSSSLLKLGENLAALPQNRTKQSNIVEIEEVKFCKKDEN